MKPEIISVDDILSTEGIAAVKSLREQGMSLMKIMAEADLLAHFQDELAVLSEGKTADIPKGALVTLAALANLAFAELALEMKQQKVAENN